jgi:hypothetical protein
MNRAERREKALIIWEESVRMMPTDLQVQAALWDVVPECHEVAEEMSEWLRAARAYPSAPKEELFFPISDT